MAPPTTITRDDRPVRLRKRPDLRFEQQTQQGRVWWIVKDPLSLKYFRLREEQYITLSMLDGQTPLSEIRDSLRRQFPAIAITNSHLYSLFTMFHQSGMVLSGSSGQGEQLLQRRKKHSRRLFISRLMSVLWIRLPGVDPDRFLTWMLPKVRWFYSSWCVGLCLALVTGSLLLITVHFDEFYARLPSFHEFFTTGNVAWLMGGLAIAKILHELGHGLTCKYFGSECHQIGLMFLVFTPCLYCDTSDSWMLPGKWKLAAIGAAGIYVELILAAFCTLIWWSTQPGLLHYLCLSTMTACSVSTLVFNLNPLLRYDGYYILSDLIEIPNLSRQARNVLVGLLEKWFLGIPSKGLQSIPMRNRTLFAVYAVAAPIYRWLVVAVILWFLSEMFEPYGLKSLGYLLIAVSLVGMIVVPLWQLIRYLNTPGRIDLVKKKRFALAVSVVTALIAAIAFVPIPHHVMATVVIQPRDAQRVYVTVPGSLSHVNVRPGESVRAGHELARLNNSELAFEITRREGRRRRLETELRNLRRQQSDDKTAVQQIPQVIESIAAAADRIRQFRADEQRLTLVTHRDGVVFPPPEIPKPRVPRGQLITHFGSPLRECNYDSWLDTGTLFCLIGQPHEMNAVLIIDQTDIDDVEINNSVEIKLDEYPTEVWRGRIAEISTNRVEVAPREASNKLGGALSTETDSVNGERPVSTSYEARVPFDAAARQLLPGFRGRAKVRVASQPVGKTIWRLVVKAFTFG